jgi:hypothetical protein
MTRVESADPQIDENVRALRKDSNRLSNLVELQDEEKQDFESRIHG